MGQFDNRVAAITGAARGIGRALAMELARRGCNLALSDIETEDLEETERRAGAEGVDVEASVVDVSERAEVYEWAERVASSFGRVHYVVNNAGVSLTASVEHVSYEDFEWLMATNFWGVVYGTKAFLPHIREAGRGRVVNVSSAFGLIASPTQSAYNAAKFAVRGFTESLRAELALEDLEVGATCVHPGGVDTSIVRDSRIGDTGSLDRKPAEVIREFEEEVARMSPEEAAEIIVEGVAEGEGRILVGADAVLMDLVQRLAAGSYPEPLAKFVQMNWRQPG